MSVPAAGIQPPAQAPSPPNRLRKALIPGLLVLVMLAFCAAITAAIVHLAKQRRGGDAGQPPTATSTNPDRWQPEAFRVLSKFLKAKTVAERMPYVIKHPGLEEHMNNFYGGGVIDDSDTPVDAFSGLASPAGDRERGIYLLTYNRPAQFTMAQFFRPLAPVAVQWGLKEPDSLLTAVANVSNFTDEPVNVMAFFLNTPEGLKLDWDTFVQTKYRTMQGFLDAAEPNLSGVFRVVIWEDIAESGKETKGFRTYHVVPPIKPTGGVRVTVDTDSELGKTLSILNWRRVAGAPKQTTRTATVELKWEVDPEPRVIINRFICWEFLGVGGKEGNHLIPPASQPAPDQTGKP